MMFRGICPQDCATPLLGAESGTLQPFLNGRLRNHQLPSQRFTRLKRRGGLKFKVVQQSVFHAISLKGGEFAPRPVFYATAENTAARLR